MTLKSASGLEPAKYKIAIPNNMGKMSIKYEFYSNVDRILVYYDEKMIYDSGFVSGYNQVFRNINGDSYYVTVVIIPSPSAVTAWDFKIGCPYMKW